jgi:phosphoglycolate phosphatase-like HAD superfamily hydrolase
MTDKMVKRIALSLVVFFLCISSLAAQNQAFADSETLRSWNDGAARRGILKFVMDATNESSPQFVAPEKRIAVFDQDGTLWVEQPMYTQFVFALDRIKEMAPSHEEWKSQAPFSAILRDDVEKISNFSKEDIERILAVTHSGMSIDEFHGMVNNWLATAKHPRFKRPYTDLVYEPMLEVVKYLRSNGFKTYIVTGGGQEFARAYAEKVYGIPPEQVVGTIGKTQYSEARDGTPSLIKIPKVLLINDKAGKPAGINLMIGRRPVAAFGNSSGDKEMLEWTQTSKGATLMMLVHHDDAEREYSYGQNSRIGVFPEALMKQAENSGWIVISIKKDWKRIFSFDN